MAPSVPRTKTSRRPAFYGQAAGPVPAAICPPREVQLDHAAPFQSLCHRAPSVPRAETSIRPLPGEVAAGDEVRDPLRDSQLDHDVPLYDLCHRAPFVPSAKTSRRPEPHEQAAGPVPTGICPPREVQAFQVAPLFVVVLDQRAPSVPRAKTSITVLVGEVAAGDEVRDPPRDCQLDPPDPD